MVQIRAENKRESYLEICFNIENWGSQQKPNSHARQVAPTSSERVCVVDLNLFSKNAKNIEKRRIRRL